MMTSNPKLPGILGGCGCLSLLASLVMFGVATFMFSGSSGVSGPAKSKADMAHYVNTREGRTGNLAENYVDFSFDYPKTWTLKNDQSGSNFVTVDRTVEEKTWENLNVGYFQTAGSQLGDETLYSQLVASLQAQFEQQLPGLRKVSEGKRAVGPYEGYEALFESTVQADGQPLQVYTRAILLPTPDHKKGVALVMMGTSFHPELKQAGDLAAKGELPAILDSFRFGN